VHEAAAHDGCHSTVLDNRCLIEPAFVHFTAGTGDGLVGSKRTNLIYRGCQVPNWDDVRDLLGVKNVHGFRLAISGSSPAES